MAKATRDYELGIVINPEMNDEQARAIVDRITGVISANGGQVVRVNAWGRRRLAYPIEHHRDGLYFFFDLMLPPTAVAELERNLRVMEEIIRSLIIVRDPRIVEQQRQRESEADARAAAEAEARAAAAAASAAAATEGTPATVGATTPEASETSTATPEAEEAKPEA